MPHQIPGTVLLGEDEDFSLIDRKLDSLFLAGGMTRAQIVTLTGLESHAVQNWVKRGFLAPPVGKRYTKRQLCRILNINALKNALPMERICGLLTYINGALDDESDDLIDDAELYVMFVRLVGSTGMHVSDARREEAISREMEGYQEPVPGARARIAKVLKIMLVAWASAALQAEAETLLQNLEGV